MIHSDSMNDDDRHDVDKITFSIRLTPAENNLLMKRALAERRKRSSMAVKLILDSLGSESVTD